jgi:hypothetical protein
MRVLVRMVVRVGVVTVVVVMVVPVMIVVVIVRVAIAVMVVILVVMTMRSVGLTRPADGDGFRGLPAAAGVAHGRPPFRRRSR